MIIRRIISVSFFLFFSHLAYNQGIPIGEWRTHLPLNKIIAVVEAENIIYAATPNSIFYYDKSDNSVHQLNKVSGLSDVGISAISYSKQYKTLIISYINANIDLVINNKIINVPDIKNKSIPGKKSINNITTFGKYAYLSCGFGIVVVDLLKNEIKDTYLIGNNGSRIDILDIAINDSLILAATEVGIYRAASNQFNLADFNKWSRDTLINDKTAKYSKIIFFSDKIIVCKDRKNSIADTLFAFNGLNWTAFDTSIVNDITIKDDKLIITHYGVFEVINNQFQQEVYIYNIDQKYITPNSVIIDNDYNFWIADNNYGLIRLKWGNLESQFILPNSPYTQNAFNLIPTSKGVLIAPGGIDYGSWGNAWIPSSIHLFSDENWINYDRNNISGFDTIIDIVDIAIDPSDNSHIFAASWAIGVIEILDNKIIKIYNETNSSLQAIYISGNRYTLRVGSIEFDEAGNLWCTNDGVSNRISVRYKNGSWESFDISNIVDNNLSTILIDNNGYKWMQVRENRLAVFNKKQNVLQKAWFNINKGNDLSTNKIQCFTQDLDDEIWIGTDKGIKVIYSPENVFNTNATFESSITAQTILLEYGGYVQHLLEFESVTAIAVDGANRKWIGTQKAGIFLVSADGTQQIANFTTDNSPLLSNSIFSISISPETGEVFIGTDKGVISYRGTATKGETSNKDVYAFPNPVRPGYDGSIAVKGLTRDANVKITDISGNLVFHTIANGGQAIWNGKKFNGEKVQTGVYLVFSTNSDGEETIVCKILFVN